METCAFGPLSHTNGPISYTIDCHDTTQSIHDEIKFEQQTISTIQAFEHDRTIDPERAGGGGSGRVHNFN